MRLRILPFAAVVLVGILAMTAFAQESQTFVMDRVTATAIGSTVASTSYETTVVIGQESPAGAASFCNTGFIASFGFWSVLGDLPVPIRLEVAKDPVDPTVVHLSWTGADDPFQVFRSVAPEDVLDPMNLDGETSACAAADPQAGAENLLFYRVIARPGD